MAWARLKVRLGLKKTRSILVIFGWWAKQYYVILCAIGINAHQVQSDAHVDKEGGAAMRSNHGYETSTDALVIFGLTGDLVHKMIFSALYGMASNRCRAACIWSSSLPWWSWSRFSTSRTLCKRHREWAARKSEYEASASTSWRDTWLYLSSWNALFTTIFRLYGATHTELQWCFCSFGK